MRCSARAGVPLVQLEGEVDAPHAQKRSDYERQHLAGCHHARAAPRLLIQPEGLVRLLKLGKVRGQRHSHFSELRLLAPYDFS